MAINELFTAAEVADRVRVRPETVRVWGRQGVIPRVCVSRKVIRFDLAAVLRALAARKGEGRSHG